MAFHEHQTKKGGVLDISLLYCDVVKHQVVGERELWGEVVSHSSHWRLKY